MTTEASNTPGKPVNPDTDKLTPPAASQDRTSYVDKLQEQLNTIELKLSTLGEEMGGTAEQVDQDVKDKMAALQQELARTKLKARALASASGDAWEMARMGIEDALQDIKTGLEGAWEEFKERKDEEQDMP